MATYLPHCGQIDFERRYCPDRHDSMAVDVLWFLATIAVELGMKLGHHAVVLSVAIRGSIARLRFLAAAFGKIKNWVVLRMNRAS
jgi:hypothetical protein